MIPTCRGVEGPPMSQHWRLQPLRRVVKKIIVFQTSNNALYIECLSEIVVESFLFH